MPHWEKGKGSKREKSFATNWGRVRGRGTQGTTVADVLVGCGCVPKQTLSALEQNMFRVPRALVGYFLAASPPSTSLLSQPGLSDPHGMRVYPSETLPHRRPITSNLWVADSVHNLGKIREA